MRRIFVVALLAPVAAVAAFAQEFRPLPNPPVTKTVAGALRTAGNFKTFLSLLEQAGLKNLGLRTTRASTAARRASASFRT